MRICRLRVRLLSMLLLPIPGSVELALYDLVSLFACLEFRIVCFYWLHIWGFCVVFLKTDVSWIGVRTRGFPLETRLFVSCLRFLVCMFGFPPLVCFLVSMLGVLLVALLAGNMEYGIVSQWLDVRTRLCLRPVRLVVKTSVLD